MDPDQQRDEANDYVVATYEEIRLRFGLGGTDQARIKAKRRKWPAEPRNHPGAIARIRMPRAEWDAAAAEIEGERSRRSDHQDHDLSRRFRILDNALAAFREERDRLLVERDAATERARAMERHLEEIRAEREEAWIRAAKAEAALEELRAIPRIRAARAEAAPNELQEIPRIPEVRAEATLEEARRPFWRRWIG